MSLWWARREQLDGEQVRLIEELPLTQSHLVLGAPGSGKTNVLLRRAQYVRTQSMPNVMVLTFTRSLTEFVKTGCYDGQGREIFPPSCVSTIEGWVRDLYRQHDADLPEERQSLDEWKQTLALGACEFIEANRLPKFDALFVDEAQDLLPEEVNLINIWSEVQFYVGDDRQRIYRQPSGLESVREIQPKPSEHLLPFHYRLAPELCEMADRILTPEGGHLLSATSHYDGPRPGRISAHGPISRDDQISGSITRLVEQLRAYSDMIGQGDRLGIIVPRQDDRDIVWQRFEQDPALSGKSKIIRARTGRGDDPDYHPGFSPNQPIVILTEKGCKGLEFRAVHWLFCNELQNYRHSEHYYTMVTRAKTSLDLYFDQNLPRTLAKAFAPPTEGIW